MKTETYIKGIIEGAIKHHFHSVFASIPSEAEKTSFTIKVSQDFVVHFQRKSGLGGNFFEVYSFRKDMEGVFFASRTPQGHIGKVVELKHRSTDLTKNHNVESLLVELERR